MVIIIAFSGVTDSIAMVLFYLFELNIPKERIELWHHDVDGHGEELFDWKTTPQYCQAFADACIAALNAGAHVNAKPVKPTARAS